MRILMVCLGNICRSPLAEGILKKKINDKNLAWEVDSAGTGSWHIGELPDPRSIQVARRYGIDITDQRARQLVPSDVHDFDYIFAMDKTNFQDIKRVWQSAGGSARVEMVLDRLRPGQEASVPDPYWDDNGFEDVYRLLDEATDEIIRQLSED